MMDVKDRSEDNQRELLEELRSHEKLTPKQRRAIEPQPMPEQPPEVRRHNIQEVPLGLSATAAMIEAYRCIDCKKAPCVSGCPVGIDIPGFIRRIQKGDFKGAIQVIRETNCLPAVTGRVCPQEVQCQAKCTVGKVHKDVSMAVSIGRLERFVADWERDNKQFEKPETAPSTGKRVAVVGSGPAGLTVAGDLVRLGHGVTVFEAFHKPGGVLVYGIPEFRLPKESIVQKEVDLLETLGVCFEMNVVIGQTITIDELLEEEGFDAVFVATGAGLPYFLGLPGEELIGVYSGNEYLTRANLMRGYGFPETDTPMVPSKNVAVFGGGNVAMDSARTALRLGAENVYLVYRRSREEMPARNEEIHHAEEEGVQFMLLNNPVRFHGSDEGRLKAVELLQMELGEADASGRRRPVPVEDSNFKVEIDTAIISIGNGPNPLVPATTPGLETSPKGNIIADRDSAKTSKRGVFAGGDIVLGAATVILAMGEGRRAARAIDEYLKTGKW